MVACRLPPANVNKLSFGVLLDKRASDFEWRYGLYFDVKGQQSDDPVRPLHLVCPTHASVPKLQSDRNSLRRRNDLDAQAQPLTH